MYSFDIVQSLSPSRDVHPQDTMYKKDSPDHYFAVGRSMLWAVFNCLNLRASYKFGLSNIERIFDFGCGYGRVTRYFRSAFPEAEVHVTDFDARGVQFCVEQFQCLDTQGGIAENFYDLIFLGSVFTHLPSQTVSQLLPLLLKALRPNGVLIFTTQGRFPVERMRGFDWENDKGRSWMHYNLEREAFEKLVRMFQETDYGFVDYPKRTGYGVAIASPFWYSREILKNTSFIQILLQEKGFDNHQDVSAFMRADVADLAKGPLFFARG